jgi:hypothetical protein
VLQLEGVLYACQKHCELLPDGSRAGFMIGDGAGVGKVRRCRVHAQPMKHGLKASGTKRLNPKCDKLLPNVAFRFNLRRYSAGRQISGIILDNFSRGRKRHLWISSSTDLHRDAQRDLRDLGCHVKVINNCQAGWALTATENKHSTDVEPTPPPPRVCSSIHPESPAIML